MSTEQKEEVIIKEINPDWDYIADKAHDAVVMIAFFLSAAWAMR